MVNKGNQYGNHSQMALIQVSEILLFTQNNPYNGSLIVGWMLVSNGTPYKYTLDTIVHRCLYTWIFSAAFSAAFDSCSFMVLNGIFVLYHQYES